MSYHIAGLGVPNNPPYHVCFFVCLMFPNVLYCDNPDPEMPCLPTAKTLVSQRRPLFPVSLFWLATQHPDTVCNLIHGIVWFASYTLGPVGANLLRM